MHRDLPCGLDATMNAVDRRTFLKRMAVAAVAGTVVTPREDGATARAPDEAQAGVTWKKAPCVLCGVGCGLLVGIQKGRAVGVRGDPDSAVSRGLACAKGYHSVQTLYARDRITRALVRQNGTLAPVALDQALDLVARRLRETIDRHGRNSVGIYGSAEWTIPDSYVAAKFCRGALGTHNLDTSARLFTASAAAGLDSTFGGRAPVGCYDDIDHADVFVLWNVNLAETDPVLFSRMLTRKRRDPAVRIIELATRTTRTSYASDLSLIFKPQTELAIANALSQEIVARDAANHDFIDQHVAFKRGKTGIGYGLNAEPVIDGDGVDASWNDYKAFLAAYTPERAQQLSGVPADSIRWLASLYADRSRKVVTAWGDAVNQHVRGTWLNNLLYNVHLLTGKIASPGNAALCLTGQPGTGIAYSTGAEAGSLPRGTTQHEEDRQRAAQIWSVPADRIAPQPGPTAIQMFRALERGDIRMLWIQGTNPMAALPDQARYARAAAREDRFIVVSEAYPTATTDVADVVLPAALWIEREGIVVNAEGRLQHFAQMVPPPADASSDAWLMIEVARRLGHGALFPWQRPQHVEQIWEEYRKFTPEAVQAVPPLTDLRGQVGATRPAVQRYSAPADPAADRARGAFDFYGHADHRAWIWLRPFEPAAESPDREYPFWFTTGSVLEHWGTGTLTRRVPALHRAVPSAYLEINRDDARSLGIANGEMVRVVSRRGSLEIQARIDFRGQPPRGLVFAPTFDDAHPVARLLLDAVCPISGQPEARCAVRVERLTQRGQV